MYRIADSRRMYNAAQMMTNLHSCAGSKGEIVAGLESSGPCRLAPTDPWVKGARDGAQHHQRSRQRNA